MVIRAGQLYDREALNQLLDGAAAEPID